MATLVAALGLLIGCGDAQPRLEDLRDLQANERFEATVTPLRTLLDQSPDDPELNHFYGLALLRTGQAGLAVWPLRKAAAAPGREIEDGLLLAQALLSGGSAHDAIAAASRVLEMSPDNLDALRLRIAARIQQSQNEEALADADVLLAHAPDDLRALLDKLSALLRLDRIEEAEEVLDAARAASEADPDSQWRPQLCATAATFAQEKGEIEAAREQWQLCVEEFGADETVVLEAVAFFDGVGDRRNGTAILRRAQETAPGHLGHRVSLAQRLEAAGLGEEAERLLLDATVENPKSFQVWMALAGFYEAREDFPQAANSIRRAFEQISSPPPILQARYADMLIRSEDLAAAEDIIRGLDGQPAMAKMLTGRLLLARGKPRAALEALDAGLRLWPGNAPAHWLAGQAAEGIGDYDRAGREYIEAVRADQGNRDALAALIRLHDAQGSTADLLPILSRYRKKRPRDPFGWVQSIRFAANSGRPEMASKLATEFSRLPGQAGLAVAEMATIRSRSDGPDAAVKTIERSGLELTNPWNAPALGILVENLGSLERHSEAIALAERAVAKNGSVAVFQEIRARALHAAGRPSAQIQDAVNLALSQGPELLSALMLAASLAADSGDTAAAIAFYDRASSVDDSNPEPNWRAIKLLLASDRDAEVEVEVEPRLASMLLRHGYHSGAANLRARILLEQGDLESALPLAQRAVRFLGGAEALDTLGSILLERAEGEPAAEALGRSLELRADAPSTRYKYARALLLIGETDEARTAFLEALRTAGSGDQAFPEADNARSELARLSSGS